MENKTTKLCFYIWINVQRLNQNRVNEVDDESTSVLKTINFWINGFKHSRRSNKHETRFRCQYDYEINYWQNAWFVIKHGDMYTWLYHKSTIVEIFIRYVTVDENNNQNINDTWLKRIEKDCFISWEG